MFLPLYLLMGLALRTILSLRGLQLVHDIHLRAVCARIAWGQPRGPGERVRYSVDTFEVISR